MLQAEVSTLNQDLQMQELDSTQFKEAIEVERQSFVAEKEDMLKKLSAQDQMKS